MDINLVNPLYPPFMGDPFCGCGTALVAAQRLKRKWIGIDITHLAIGIMKWRLEQAFHGIKYTVIGEPEDLAGATKLAEDNKYQFQWWAVAKIGGQPYGEKKKGADTGIDGYKYFTDEVNKVKKAIISVKGGGTSKRYKRINWSIEARKFPNWDFYYVRKSYNSNEKRSSECRDL